MSWAFYEPDNEFVAPTFSETNVINRIHNFPRFGYPSDISYVASESREEKNQYFYGAVFVSAIVLLIFIVWNIFLYLLRYAGYERIGVLSGDPPLLSYPSENAILYDIRNSDTDNDEGKVSRQVGEETIREIEEWQYQYQKARNQMDRMRIFFVMSSSIVIVASFVLYISGLAPLEHSFIAVRDEVKDMQDDILASRDQMGDQYLASTGIIPQRDAVLENVIGWCPNVGSNSSISDNIVPSNQTEIILDSDGQNNAKVGGLKISVEESFSNLENMIASGAQSVARSLVIASANAEEVEDGMTRFIFWYGLSMFFIVVIDVLTLILLGGVYTASRANPSRFVECIESKLVIPLFTIFINVAWIVTAIFAVIAVLSADMCTGSPEKNIVAIFHEKEQTMDPLLYSMTKYYVESCMESPVDETNKPTVFIDDFTSYVEDSILITNTFVTEINMFGAIVSESSCGGESLEDLSKNLTDFSIALTEFQETVNNSSSSLYCSVFTPTYANIMHDQICYRGVNSLSVIFIMLLLITTNGMTMMTLRVAVKAIEFDDEDHDDDELDLEESFVITGLQQANESESTDALLMKEKEKDKSTSMPSTLNFKDDTQMSSTIIKESKIVDEMSEADLESYPISGVLSTDNNEIEVSFKNDLPATNPEVSNSDTSQAYDEIDVSHDEKSNKKCNPEV